MPEATPFQVMIVDDHPLMRRGVRQLLELDPGFEVVAEAGDAASAIDLANRLDIDVILLDLNMKGMSGLDNARHAETGSRRSGRNGVSFHKATTTEFHGVSSPCSSCW